MNPQATYGNGTLPRSKSFRRRSFRRSVRISQRVLSEYSQRSHLWHFGPQWSCRPSIFYFTANAVGRVSNISVSGRITCDSIVLIAQRLERGFRGLLIRFRWAFILRSGFRAKCVSDVLCGHVVQTV